MAAAANSKTQVDLIDCIEWPSLECLNANPKHGIVNAIKQGYREDDGLHLESDVDEQLLVYVPFNQVVKLHSMVIKGPSDSGPKTVRLYANRTSMGFSNVNDFPASDTLTLTPEQLKGEQPVPLKYVKFQNVRSLTVFIENNQDDTDTTTVQKISILGSTVETTNMKELKKVDKE